MKKFLIEYENAHWCGASGTYCVVNAKDADEAVIIASDHMEQEMRDLFSSEYEDEDEGWQYDDESAVSVTNVEEFDDTHEAWNWYLDPVQSQFYPEVN